MMSTSMAGVRLEQINLRAGGIWQEYYFNSCAPNLSGLEQETADSCGIGT